jgi:hypothetical protein
MAKKKYRHKHDESRVNSESYSCVVPCHKCPCHVINVQQTRPDFKGLLSYIFLAVYAGTAAPLYALLCNTTECVNSSIYAVKPHINHRFPGQWIGRGGPQLYLPESPDLSPPPPYFCLRGT